MLAILCLYFIHFSSFLLLCDKFNIHFCPLNKLKIALQSAEKHSPMALIKSSLYMETCSRFSHLGTIPSPKFQNCILTGGWWGSWDVPIDYFVLFSNSHYLKWNIFLVVEWHFFSLGEENQKQQKPFQDNPSQFRKASFCLPSKSKTGQYQGQEDSFWLRSLPTHFKNSPSRKVLWPG